MSEPPPAYTNQPPPQPAYPPAQPPPGYSQPPPPAPGYSVPPPQQQQQTTVVVAGRAPVVGVMGFGDLPMNMTCPHCSANIVTRTNYVIGTMVWIVAGVMILFGLWLGCCLIPFCINSLKDVEHYCPNCNRHLGTKVRLS